MLWPQGLNLGLLGFDPQRGSRPSGHDAAEPESGTMAAELLVKTSWHHLCLESLPVCVAAAAAAAGATSSLAGVEVLAAAVAAKTAVMLFNSP